MADGNDVDDEGRTATPSIAEDITLLIDSIGTTRHEDPYDIEQLFAAGERLRAWLAVRPEMAGLVINWTTDHPGYTVDTTTGEIVPAEQRRST